MTAPKPSSVASELMMATEPERPVECGARLEFRHGGKRTLHSWRCVMPAEHAGLHCTPMDSEWAATA